MKMMNASTSVERGYPLLADISGFVPFVKDSETDHANEIIRELLEFIIARLEPIFTLAQIDGDAIFAYAPQERITRGETLFEILETIYTAYKDQLIQTSRVRTCGCNACRNTSRLDLKFAVHFGEYVPHDFRDKFDLIGLAPLFVRKREWKEPVRETTDWRGYALFTQECLDHLGLHPEEMRATEVPGGSVRTFGLNLESRYNSMLERRRVFVDQEDAQNTLSLDFRPPPADLWQWYNDPDKRTEWFILKWSARSRIKGRTGSGSVNHCYHGIGDTLETILDWHPFEYFTSEFLIQPFNFRIRQTTIFEPLSDGGTRLRLNIKPAEVAAGLFTQLTCKMLAWYEKLALSRLMRMVD